MILILNNCINFDLIDIFLCRKYFIWSIFFLAQEFFYLVIYILRKRRQNFVFNFNCLIYFYGI